MSGRAAAIAENLTTILTTNGGPLDELVRTPTNSTQLLNCVYALERTITTSVSKFGNRVWGNPPWVQIPPSPLEKVANQRVGVPSR